MNPGDEIADFEAVDQTGTPVRLSELTASGPVVLFFYPKAMTKGCTAESCHFRDLANDFQAVGTQAVGISADSTERQARFDDENGLGLPLLSDPDRRIADMFGVKRPGPLFNRRMTFVIDSDRRLIEVIKSEISIDSHADRALEVLRTRSGDRPAPG